MRQTEKLENILECEMEENLLRETANKEQMLVDAFHVENDLGRTNKIFIFTICCFPIIKAEVVASSPRYRTHTRALPAHICHITHCRCHCCA